MLAALDSPGAPWQIVTEAYDASAIDYFFSVVWLHPPYQR